MLFFNLALATNGYFKDHSEKAVMIN